MTSFLLNRDLLPLDMVKFEEEVRKYKKNNDARLAGTEKRLAAATQGYQDLHSELLEDIPKLVEDKVRKV